MDSTPLDHAAASFVIVSGCLAQSHVINRACVYTYNVYVSTLLTSTEG